MRNVLLGSSMLLASVAAASAADLPVRSAAPAPVMVAAMPYNWSGFYVGLNAGGAWSSGCTNYTLLTAPNWPSTCADNNSGQFTGGAQIGYNLQSGNFVYGIEADINGVGNSNNGSRAFVYDQSRSRSARTVASSCAVSAIRACSAPFALASASPPTAPCSTSPAVSHGRAAAMTRRSPGGQ